MSRFRCRCKDSTGRNSLFTREADDVEVLRRQLISEGYFPISLRRRSSHRRRKKIRLKEVQEFAETLALLLEGGYTLKESMPLLAEFQPNGPIGITANHLAKEFERGHSLKKAMDVLPITFPPGFISLAGIGESVGSLVSVMRHLASHYKRMKSLRDRLTAALIYPSLVLLVAIAAGIFLSLVLLPILQTIMEELTATRSSGNAAMPGDGSSLSLPPIVLVSATILALLGLLLWSLRHQEAQSNFILRVPGLGRVLLDWNLMGWTFAMELLTGQGLPIDKALTEAAGTVGHRGLRQRMHKLSDMVSKGYALSDLMVQEPLIPSVLAGWIRIGEQTGRTQRVFENVRSYFEARVSRSIDLATQLIEPVLMILIGIMMIILVGRFILPAIQLMLGVL